MVGEMARHVVACLVLRLFRGCLAPASRAEPRARSQIPRQLALQQHGHALQQGVAADVGLQGHAHPDAWPGRSGQDHDPVQAETRRSGNNHSDGRPVVQWHLLLSDLLSAGSLKTVHKNK